MSLPSRTLTIGFSSAVISSQIPTTGGIMIEVGVVGYDTGVTVGNQLLRNTMTFFTE